MNDYYENVKCYCDKPLSADDSRILGMTRFRDFVLIWLECIECGDCSLVKFKPKDDPFRYGYFYDLLRIAELEKAA